jgi:hypothetical protein
MTGESNEMVQYTGTHDTSQHYVVPSDTTMFGNTSPRSLTTLLASSAMIHTTVTDLESSVDSGIDQCTACQVVQSKC